MTFAMRSPVPGRRRVVVAFAVIALVFVGGLIATSPASAHDDCGGTSGHGGDVAHDDGSGGTSHRGNDDECNAVSTTTVAAVPRATQPSVAPAPVVPAPVALAPAPITTNSGAPAGAPASGTPAPVPTTSFPQVQPEAAAVTAGVIPAVSASGGTTAEPPLASDSSAVPITAVPVGSAPRGAQLASTDTGTRAGRLVPFAIGALVGLVCLVVAGLLARRDLQRFS
jgi:hypothetical protein